MFNDKFYITTSIAYVNAEPHIGFALEQLQADALARWHRLKGESVFFSTGTDENSLKLLKAAEKYNSSPKEIADRFAKRYIELTQVMNLSHDDFIRTTDVKRHHPAAQKMWKQLEKSGDIYKGIYEGLYCVGCEAYVTKKDLIDGKCPDHQEKPEFIKEENYFFRLSKYTDEIRERIEAEDFLILPEIRRNEILSVLKNDGLSDISFSRPVDKLAMGVPVPGDESQIMYVWCDALMNYMSVIGYGWDEIKWKKWWPADVHLIGKNIIRFHAAIWPAMLLSAGIELPRRLFVHGFITMDGKKMSKSLGNVVSPFELFKKYGIDPSRYFLLREIPSDGDGDFSYARFEERYNADLVNGLGNLVQRVTTMLEKYQHSVVPKPTDKNRFVLEVEDVYRKVNELYSIFKIDKAIEKIWGFIRFCDRYIEEQKPWDLAKQDKTQELEKVLYNLIESLRHIAIFVLPIMPETSEKILQSVGFELKARILHELSSWGLLEHGTKIQRCEILFPRLNNRKL